MTTASRISSSEQSPSGGYDVRAVRNDFPVLTREVHGKPLVYLDNAASSQRPQVVLDAMSDCYERYYSNIHRGVHTLSQESTRAYEEARAATVSFLGADDPSELVFVRGTTEGVNLVAQSWGRANVQPGDEVLVTEMEHHSNIVPWQMLCKERGAQLEVIPINDEGDLDLGAMEAKLSSRTRLVALAHVSNALGTVNPVAKVIAKAHEVGALVLLDGAQAVPHMAVDVKDLDVDFYVFSGHKVFGPSGVGALWAKREILEAMPPWQGGGGMIHTVSFQETTYAPVPGRFEAGTPDIVGAIGMAASLRYLENLGMDKIAAHEAWLLDIARNKLGAIPGLRLVGNPKQQASVQSLTLEGVHPHDLGTILDQEGVAARAGHHCAQPLMDRLGVPATVRVSFALYNTEEEIDRLVTGIEMAIELFGGGNV